MYPVVRENGQKKYGPPRGWPAPEPVQGSEVFVGHLPRNMDGAELLKLFASCGVVYRLRLMMEFSGLNRGFAFVVYSRPEEAVLASRLLNNFTIQPGHQIGVVISKDNRCISIAKLPSHFKVEDVRQLVQSFNSNEIKNIAVSRDEEGVKAVIEYLDHRAASMARRDLWVIFDKTMGLYSVDWFTRTTTNPDPAMGNTTLFVTHFKKSTSKKDLEELFTFNGNLNIKQVRLIKDYAFIQYNDRSHAATALELAHSRHSFASDIVKSGCQRVHISWSKSQCSTRSSNKN